MTKYQKINMDDLSFIGEPSFLPDELVGLSDEDLADLSWTSIESLQAFGFWPVRASNTPTLESTELVDINLIENLTRDDVNKKVVGVHPRLAAIRVKVSKPNFLELFTLSERASIQHMRKVIDELSAEQYASLENTGYVLLDTYLKYFDALDIVQLGNAEVVNLINILVNSNILTQDRADSILIGNKPQEI